MHLTKEQLWRLRRQIVLGSLYYSDYINTFNIDRHLVCDFFDGFLSYVSELMQEEIPNYDDRHFSKHLRAYDNAERLWNWYECFEEDPLPLPVPEEESDNEGAA